MNDYICKSFQANYIAMETLIENRYERKLKGKGNILVAFLHYTVADAFGFFNHILSKTSCMGLIRTNTLNMRKHIDKHIHSHIHSHTHTHKMIIISVHSI